jgi:hypothetical protein
VNPTPIRGPRSRAGAVLPSLVAAWLCAAGAAFAQTPAPPADSARIEPVRVVSDAAGRRLTVGGRDFMVYGMNWDYVPIGQNYAFDLWSQSDDVIKAALDREMPLLRAMGVNAIRQYVGIPPRWVRYIHERYGIWTMLNHPVGRYGFTIEGVWYPNVDYADPRMRAALKADVAAQVERYRGTPGVLLWLLGNENNYGLAWTSFETGSLPQGERDAGRARKLYSLMGEIITATKAADPDHPVAIANGDVQYLDIIAQECKGLDVFGANVYRGISVGDLFQVVEDKLGVPVVFSEFGCDAFNARESREDQAMQARYLAGQWEEIYEQSSGKGRVGNAIGGFVFQWADGWWKYGQDSRLDVHDTHASWPDGGYVEDFVRGENNMNEEWWGICAKGPADDKGLFPLYPRAAYYALRQAFRLPAYAKDTDLAAIRAHFAGIDPASATLEARGDHAALMAAASERLRVSELRAEIQTISTGGTHLTTPHADAPQAALPAFRGFDRMQSFYAGIEGRPSDNVVGSVTVNVLGHVAENPIDEIYYEKRGRPQEVFSNGATFKMEGIERVKVYKASLSWDDRWFQLDAFHRTGHYHWGPEGDFFGLYREANYGTNIDVYNADAPSGFEVAGKRLFDGLKVAYGPELWWGANPAVLVKYRRGLGRVTATGLYQADVASQSAVSSSNAVPLPATKKATLALEHARGPFTFEVGGIWSGGNKAGQTFQIANRTSDGYEIRQSEIFRSDAFGARAKIAYERGRVHWYAQAARMGLVADGGPTAMITFTGWTLKDAGTGNQTNFITGLAYNRGRFQIGPNFLWQKPIIGPVPGDTLLPSPGRPRNVLEDPFAVRSNRETVGGELMLTYDPTPATWLWAWDNDVREDASFAGSLDFVFRHLPTTQDASIGILSDGHTTFAFAGAPPPRDLWDLKARLLSRMGPDKRLVGTLYVGTVEGNGYDPTGVNTTLDRKLLHRGGEARLTAGAMAYAAAARFNDWGPYDYHHDFNLTYPVQLSADVSRSLGAPRWFAQPQTRLGVRGTWRSLDKNSPRYDPGSGTTATTDNGSEWEFRTYVTFAM